jgi:hypothetical protein
MCIDLYLISHLVFVWWFSVLFTASLFGIFVGLWFVLPRFIPASTSP